MSTQTCETCRYYEVAEHEDRGLCTWQKYHRLPKWIGTNRCLALVMYNDGGDCDTWNNPTDPMIDALLINLALTKEEDQEKEKRLDNLVKSYQLTVSAAQAQAIEAACDLLSRIMIGQSAEIVRHLPLTDKANQWELGRAIEAMTKPACNLQMNSSYGVGFSEQADLLIDLVEVIRHKLAWDAARAENLLTPSGGRDHATMGGVCYDAPMQWARHQPLAKIEAVA